MQVLTRECAEGKFDFLMKPGSIMAHHNRLYI